MKFLLLLIFLAASSPDKVFGSCLDDCGKSVSQNEKSKSSDSVHSDSTGDDHQDKNCSCPIHSHHCCSHISLASYSHASYTRVDTIKPNLGAYDRQLLLEPFLDSLFRPPIS